MSPTTVAIVEAPRCIRCGACRALAPGVFDVVDGAACVVRDPVPEDRALVAAARLICPADAIRGGLSDDASVGLDPREPCAAFDSADTTYGSLALSAEEVRWALQTLPWAALEPAQATPALRAVVREMAISESATYSATQQFLEAFFDDLELSKWISVWFYEETRHPHVLLEWLRRVGDAVPAEVEVQGRVSTPLMRSALGTLVTNLISEITAAYAYRRLAARAAEPVLGRIARLIAGDEARHAATFFSFARQRLAAAPPHVARRDKARALEVLAAWLGGAQPTTHPVAQMLARLEDLPPDQASVSLDFVTVRGRIVRVIGFLLDLPLRRQEDVMPALRDLLGRRGAG